MQIKKFKAKTLKEAIAEMKEVFGDEAIVLSTKVIDSFENGLEQKMFEITASVDEQETFETNNNNLENSNVRDFQSEMKKMTEKIYGISGNDRTKNLTKHPKEQKVKVFDDFEKIKSQLLDKDIKTEIANSVIEKVSQYSPFVDEANRDDYLISTLGSMIPTSEFELSKQNKPKVISLVGPTGVGKTTCIAKLAVISKILHNLNIGLISIDTYRLGALDQLKIFSEISNIDFLVAYEPNDIPKFMKKFKNKDIVFIDTVGRSQNNKKLLNSINDFLKKVKVDETYLVINSTSDYKVMKDVAEKFKVLNYDALVFSKLDEAISYGNIVNLVDEFKTPIKYLTNGQVIPDDIIAADSEFIANMIYSGKLN
ncbi:MAG: AAA family ATPase [Ignavibacteriales bacterium]|nr:AAA family ATPase [Ignavibacteriales bacterium]MCB9209379.1 AAA family ATPase [Ignavibacteriales bacterium]MCB9258022.1 AAA family ATPase [Ignavibacteriales bacterium]